MHIAQLTKEIPLPPPFYYRNTETGDEYLHIAGGLAWPGKNTPDFACIIAVEKTDDPEPSFLVIEEVQENSIKALLYECLKIREKYRSRGYPELLTSWWGNYDRFYTFITELNNKLLKGKGTGLLLTLPHDFERPNHFEIYVRRIQSCYDPDRKGSGGAPVTT